MYSKKSSKKLKSKFYSPLKMALGLAAFLGVLAITVLTVTTGSFDVRQQAAYLNLPCSTTVPCPAGQYCSNSRYGTVTGTCLDYTCSLATCPKGCKSPASRHNDCNNWCNTAACGNFGCITENAGGGTCAVSGKCKCAANTTCNADGCQVGQHCEYRSSTSGYNAACVPDRTPTASYACFGGTKFCSKNTCPAGYSRVTDVGLKNGCYENKDLATPTWVCCQKTTIP